MKRSDWSLCGLAVVFGALTVVLRYHPLGKVAPFAVAILALGVLAALVGRSIEGLGDRLGAGATGVLQSALGNLPELFVGIFALRAGLVEVVRAALIGSILANVLLVLGVAFTVGGLRHGRQTFDSRRARELALLLLLAASALAIPTLVSSLHTPAAHHEGALSAIVSVILLLVFVASVPGSLARTEVDEAVPPSASWSLGASLGVLAGASIGAAFVSDFFVDALTPAISNLHISQAFAGLVIVAVAGNAVENVVGVQLMARNRPDYAVSAVLNSPLQIALFLAPVLVLLSHVLGGAVLTLALPPLLLAALAISVLCTSYVVVDGESTWLEGVTLVGLYAVITSSFWWG